MVGNKVMLVVSSDIHIKTFFMGFVKWTALHNGAFLKYNRNSVNSANSGNKSNKSLKHAFW